MQQERFSLNVPTRAVDTRDKGFIVVPQGAVLSVQETNDGGRLLKVLWGERELLILSQDLAERGNRLPT
ncbi:MAG: hypothetical protein JOZ62_06795 [Acidobacteriaceae bacterium]|nr:hypothetical protein [Acidobacteriaceae bacterium]